MKKKTNKAKRTKKIDEKEETSLVAKKTKKGKKQKKPVKHPKLRKAIKIFFLTMFIFFVILVGVAAGMIFGLFGGDLALTEEDLTIGFENSVLLDIDGNQIAELSGDENRKIISKSEMSPYLEKAFISIEDERFESHNGVDLPRTMKATLTFLTNGGESSFGGSTITQQVVKNITGEKDNSEVAGAVRKVKEIARAYELEKLLSKDQILELYLNLIPLGGGAKNIYGVEKASEYYFNKNAKDLTIVESAYLAGITHSPNRYDPYVSEENKEERMERINTRVTTVLDKMLELGKITQEEYNASIDEVKNGIKFEQGNFSTSYTYLAEEAIKEVIKDLQLEYGWDEEVARLHVYGSGYTIHTTQDTRIQKIVEEVYASDKYITYSGDTQVQSGMPIIQNGTGYVVGIAGALGEKTTFGLNRATTAAGSPGSTIKPIAVIAPALEKGIITAGSVVDDVPTYFGGYNPKNWYGGFKGLSNIRFMLRISQNITEVKLLRTLTPANSVEFLKKMGITSLDDKKDENLSLALGGVTYGISPLEMAAAYSVFANGGTYVEPTFYKKVEDKDGNIVLETKQETRKVMSEGNAFIMTQLLREPIVGSGGTATGAFSRYTASIPVSGKTGTSDNNEDSSFVGFTPYYTSFVLYRYEGKHASVKDNAKVIWVDVMNKVLKGLEKKSFTAPSSVTRASICKDSGLLATELCSQDPRGSRVYSEYFVKGTVPGKKCTCHVKGTICKESNLLATEYCKDKEEKIFISRENSEKDKGWEKAADAEYMIPTKECDKHTAPPDTEKPTIKLKGDATITLKLNAKYEEKGATATDKVDGDITEKIEISGTVDTKKVGTYTITYKVKDAAGNEATTTRKVVVKEKVKENDKNTTNTINNNTTTNTVKNNTTTNNTTNTTTNSTTNTTNTVKDNTTVTNTTTNTVKK